MFWVGFVVGIVFTFVFMFELGRFLERHQGNRKKVLPTDNKVVKCMICGEPCTGGEAGKHKHNKWELLPPKEKSNE